MFTNLVLCACLLLLATSVCVLCTPPNLHTRTHGHHGHEGQTKERIEDAFDAHLHQVNAENDINDNELDHEAILGSRQKAQEFDSLAPEEAKRRLKKLTETQIDHNQDGFVDQSELTNWVLMSFKNLAVEEGEDRLEEDDENADGFVSWEEYIKAAFDIDAYLKDSKNELLAEDEVLWKAADVNKDGKLDPVEYAAFNSPEEFEHMHRVLVEQMLTRRDRNHNGVIDFEEFITDERGEKAEPKSDIYLSEKDKFENEYDLNHDNKLDFEECLRWIVPNNTEIAENEARHLISSADDDHDQRLSIEEVVANHEVFVGSEATNFGEQLHGHALDEL